MTHHASGQDEMINIQVESFDDDTVPVADDSASYTESPRFSEFFHVSDDEVVWTSGSSGPASPAAHAPRLVDAKDVPVVGLTHASAVHVRTDSSSSLSLNHLSPPPIRPPAVDTRFHDYRSTAQDPIFSPEDAFAGHEFPDTDDGDALLFGSTSCGTLFSDGQQAPSPVDSQLDLSAFGLQTAPVIGPHVDAFLHVPAKPNRPRSNTHEGTIPTVAPKDVFPPATFSIFSPDDSAAYKQQFSTADSAIADDFFPNPHSPVDSMKSTSSTLFGALGQEHWITPIPRTDNRRRRSDTGAMVKPTIHQIQAHQPAAFRFRPTAAAATSEQAHTIPITQQQLSPQSLQVYSAAFANAVIPDLSSINSRQRSTSINSSSPRGRGIVRSTPGSRRHSPYPQANKLPMPPGELESYSATTAPVNGLSEAVDQFIKPEDQEFTLCLSGGPGLNRNRTVPAGSPNHVPLPLNVTVKRSPSNPMGGRYGSLGMETAANRGASASGMTHGRHLSLNEQATFLQSAIKTEMNVPSLMPPISLGVQRPTVTSDATREASLKRRTKPPKFFCECGEDFTARHNYERHLQAHEGRRPFLCACGTAFTSKSDRKRHISKSLKDECKAPPIDQP